MRRVAKVAAATVGLLLLLAAGAGQLLGGGVLRPGRVKLTPNLVVRADQGFVRLGAAREDFGVCGPDGIVLRGIWSPPRFRPGLLRPGLSDSTEKKRTGRNACPAERVL